MLPPTCLCNIILRTIHQAFDSGIAVHLMQFCSLFAVRDWIDGQDQISRVYIMRDAYDPFCKRAFKQILGFFL